MRNTKDSSFVIESLALQSTVLECSTRLVATLVTLVRNDDLESFAIAKYFPLFWLPNVFVAMFLI